MKTNKIKIVGSWFLRGLGYIGFVSQIYQTEQVNIADNNTFLNRALKSVLIFDSPVRLQRVGSLVVRRCFHSHLATGRPLISNPV